MYKFVRTVVVHEYHFPFCAQNSTHPDGVYNTRRTLRFRFVFFLLSQVFHICQHAGLKSSFMCPEGSVFNQQLLVCDWWFDTICEAPQSPLATTTTPAPPSTADSSTAIPSSTSSPSFVGFPTTLRALEDVPRNDLSSGASDYQRRPGGILATIKPAEINAGLSSTAPPESPLRFQVSVPVAGDPPQPTQHQDIRDAKVLEPLYQSMLLLLSAANAELKATAKAEFPAPSNGVTGPGQRQQQVDDLAPISGTPFQWVPTSTTQQSSFAPSNASQDNTRQTQVQQSNAHNTQSDQALFREPSTVRYSANDISWYNTQTSQPEYLSSQHSTSQPSYSVQPPSQIFSHDSPAPSPQSNIPQTVETRERQASTTAPNKPNPSPAQYFHSSTPNPNQFTGNVETPLQTAENQHFSAHISSQFHQQYPSQVVSGSQFPSSQYQPQQETFNQNGQQNKAIQPGSQQPLVDQTPSQQFQTYHISSNSNPDSNLNSQNNVMQQVNTPSYSTGIYSNNLNPPVDNSLEVNLQPPFVDSPVTNNRDPASESPLGYAVTPGYSSISTNKPYLPTNSSTSSSEQSSSSFNSDNALTFENSLSENKATEILLAHVQAAKEVYDTTRKIEFNNTIIGDASMTIERREQTTSTKFPVTSTLSTIAPSTEPPINLTRYSGRQIPFGVRIRNLKRRHRGH